MRSKQENKISREEIIKYVDELIEENKESYDKRLSSLLYEFFLRANEKFEWSKDDFFEKYQNFRINAKTLRFEELEKLGRPPLSIACYMHTKDTNGIFLSEKILEMIKEDSTNDSINTYIIENLFHECTHEKDLCRVEILKHGFYKVIDNKINDSDTMLDEYANVLSTSLLSSDKPMYADNLGIDVINSGSYGNLNLPGSIMCAAFDITEIQLAKMKDKGRDNFDLYLKNKFPYYDTNSALYTFKSSLNVIHNADINNDKENMILGFGNIIDVAFKLAEIRLDQSFKQEQNKKESLERVYYDIYKIEKLIKEIDEQYAIDRDNEVYNSERRNYITKIYHRIHLYNRFFNNKNLFTVEEKTLIDNCVDDSVTRKVAEILIESKFKEDYIDLEFDIEEIAKKYYIQSNEPLNDNTKLIEQIRESFREPITKEMEVKEQLPKQSEELKASNFRNSIRYETPIIHDRSTEQQDTLRVEEESTRE